MHVRKNDRQQWILAELARFPALRVGELALRLNVTTETIRRDLKELTGAGHLARTYGGAIKMPPSEPGITERHGLFVEERKQIARRAADLLRDGKTFYIGSGATTTQVARRIALTLNHITVFTHSFGVATVLSFNPTIQVMLLPGWYHAQEGATYGAMMLRYMDDIRADFAIIGASGLMEDGPNEALPEMAEVYKAMVHHSQSSLVVADHSKVMRQFTARYANWREIDALVTDHKFGGDPLGKKIGRAGVSIIEVEMP